MAAEIGVGLVGLGFVGAGAHLPALKKIDHARLAGIADRNEAVLDKQAAKHGVSTTYTNYEELLRNPAVEAVIVSVPTQYHAPVALAALQAGKHVLCEMPLAPRLEQVDAMVAAARKAGVILMPSLNFRFTPNYVKAKQLIEQGALGKPVAIMYREFIPAADLAKQWPPGAWVWNLEEAGGPLFTLSVWSIDLMRWLLGKEIVEVQAAVKHSPIEKLGGTLGYNAFANYRFEDDVVGCLQSSGSVTHGASTSVLDVIGDNTHSITATWNNALCLLAEEPDKTEWIFREAGGHRVWGHMQMDQHFVDSIVAGRQPSIKPEDGRKAVEAALKLVGKLPSKNS